MREHTLRALITAMLMLLSLTGYAQDRNNEEELVKIDARASQFSYREGEIIVKFKPTGALKMRSNAKGQFATSGVNNIDAVLQSIGVESVETLMPFTGKEVTRRSARAINGQEIVARDLSQLYRLRIDADKVQSVYEAIEKLQVLEEVEFAEPNYIVYSTATTAGEYNDPLYPDQWYLEAVNLPALWQVPTISDERPIIGILDTGVEFTHIDLLGNVWANELELNGTADVDDDGNGFVDDMYGWDFVNQTNRMDDYNGHGTHCAGIAAATAGNEKGIVGANPDALIMPIAVMQSDGTGDIATIIKGIDYATANGVDVLSMSLGTYAQSVALEQALAKAYQKAVLVAAAGNDNLCIYPHECPINRRIGAPMFPAAYTFVLGVQASVQEGGLASFSNYDEDGATLCNSQFYSEEQLYNYELTAPGVSMMSTYPGGRYKALNGTSMACPLVAGGISRLLQTKEYASKELLFGDLIHASAGGDVDFYATYQITDADRQPTLQLVTYQLNDSTGGDGDLRADAGETIAFYPTLRNNWGLAENIKITLELPEEEDQSIVRFLDNDVDYGCTLSSYSKNKAANPVRFTVREDCVDGRHIRLLLRATCDNIAEELVQEFVITIENGVEIGGMISEDLTLYPDVHYIVTRPLAVPDGVTLTIKPGTILKFKAGTGLSLAKNAILDCVGEPGNMIVFTMADGETGNMIGFSGNGQTMNYVQFYGLNTGTNSLNQKVYTINCEYINCNSYTIIYKNNKIEKCNFFSNQFQRFLENTFFYNFKDCNYNNNTSKNASNINLPAEDMNFEFYSSSNFYNNKIIIKTLVVSTKLLENTITCATAYYSETPSLYTPEYPSYFGTSREDIARENILDMENPYNPIGFGKVDLSNMLTQPVAEAHGIVWKVVVNGYDAQDEYELLPPLGVGKHKFEVYFNRPMNKAVAPTIAMGVRPPYTQNSIAEEGSWNNEGTIYTAYLTITGKSATDGVNRIYVAGAEDDEYFEIPVENFRFNVNIQAAGSMSTGLMAEAGLGKVTLTWETDEEDFEDLMGYNIMRYTMINDSVPSATIVVNKSLIDSEEQEFVDYDVVPGTTYYYTIKQVTTSLTSHDLSNVVAATPLTASKGDANGSMSVDVADVVTEVAYMTGQDPQPFIFEAADVNSDLAVNVLDVVGTVNIIKTPAAAAATVDNSATYTIEDGILYVECPVALGGVQVRLMGVSEVTPLEALANFEFVTDNQGENGLLVLAYSMTGRSIATGKQALMRIDGATIGEIILSDVMGRNVVAIDGNAAGVGSVEAAQMQLPYPTTFVESLNIPYVIGRSGENEVSIVITDLSGRTVHRYETTANYGTYTYTWQPNGTGRGVYIVSLYMNDVLMQTAKVVKR